MRKDARTATQIHVASVDSYHGGHWGGSEDYAFEGFKSNKDFTSDRYRPTRLVDGRLMAETPDNKLVELESIGLEIETEMWGIQSPRAYAEILKRSLFPLFPDDLFKMQHDSSLGYDIDYWNCDSSDDLQEEVNKQCLGIECITQPMKIQFIRNHYKDFKAMYDTLFPALGISCSDSGRCGMHVNVSNALFGKTREKQIEAIRKLHYFINKNYSFSCSLFKRDEDQTDYCEQMPYYDAKDMYIGGGSHGTCMNYSHFDSGRIEIRLVGGQSNFNNFRNTMECVFFLIGRMRTIKWEELDDMTKVFKGCNQYVYKRLKYCHLPSDTLMVILDGVKENDLELVD